MGLIELVSRHLPPPARLLEVGCGSVGELAYGLAQAGYEVTAIDPMAPEGPLFQRISLEDFAPTERYDAVVASLALHHIPDPEATAARLHHLLVPGGLLVLEEWDEERFLETATSSWYYQQRRACAALDPFRADRISAPYEEWRQGWINEHEGEHVFAEIQPALTRLFQERLLLWLPYLYRYQLHPSVEALERALIEEGAIQATGWRWLGEAT